MATVGEILVRGLAARGVDTVFGIPGVHTIELYRGLAGSGVRHVTARHEGGAAFMADGYARASGRPGVAFVITGPGLTNALTPIGQARQDSVPLLVISGVNARDSLGLGLGFLHELPEQAAMVRAVCPSFQITGPQNVGPVLDQAFAAMLSGRPGPVHIEVPTDVMPLACPDLPPPPAALAPRPAGEAGLAEAVERLDAARRPVILAGGGCRGMGAALRALAARLDAPVVQTTNARGLMWGEPLSVPASPSLEAVRALIEDADAVLALGTEFGRTDYDMYATGRLPRLRGLIRADVCAAQLARHPAEVALCADAGEVARALAARVQRKAADGARRAAACLAAARASLADLSEQMPLQLACVEAMRDAVPEALIVGDSTQPIYAANLVYDHDRAGGWFNAATGFGALGYGPAAAVGAAVACPGARVIALVGDGGLQFSPGELRTAVDEGLDIAFVVWNSASYQEIAEAMRAAQAPVIGCHPSPLKMEAFAAACDLPFVSVPAEPARISSALRDGPRGPRLIEVRAFRDRLA